MINIAFSETSKHACESKQVPPDSAATLPAALCCTFVTWRHCWLSRPSGEGRQIGRSCQVLKIAVYVQRHSEHGWVCCVQLEHDQCVVEQVCSILPYSILVSCAYVRQARLHTHLQCLHDHKTTAAAVAAATEYSQCSCVGSMLWHTCNC